MTQIIILAAGKGTRMEDDLPKVLVPLKGKAIIKYLIESVLKSEVDKKPIVVVSPDNKEIISEYLKEYDIKYVIQTEQLGTGHALNSVKNYISENTERVMVLYGDHPFIQSNSIKKFAVSNSSVVTVMPTKLVNFEDWRANFFYWGRFVRNVKNEITEIIEFKDANEEQRLLTEVNPGFMCFDSNWLFANIDKLKDDNKAQEYYLTDMVKVAFDEGSKIGTVEINPQEAIGINTKKELEVAEGLV